MGEQSWWPVVQRVAHEGYPLYVLTILGVWSLCGGITLLVPGFPRLKEWAYAGIFFEYTTAVFSKAVVPGYLRGIDDPGALLWTPLILAEPARERIGRARSGSRRI